VINVRDDIFGHLDRIHKLDQEARKDKPVNSWYASSFDTCLCGRYLHRIGTKRDSEFTPRLLTVFDVGKKEEKWLIDTYKEIIEHEPGKYQLEEQVRIDNKKYNVHGFIDLIITEKDGTKTALEIKSKHSRSFWYLTRQGAQLGHKLQLWWYLQETGIEKGLIVYLSKDDREILQFEVLRNDKELKKQALNEVKILNYCLKYKIPPPPAEKGTWQEKNCGYHQQCKKLQKEQKILTQEQIKQIINNKLK